MQNTSLETSPDKYVLNEKGVSNLNLTLAYFCKFFELPSKREKQKQNKTKISKPTN